MLAFCAPEAVPLRLLLRSRPGLAEPLSPEVAAVLVPLLEDELAAGDAVAALRGYSLVRPAGEGAVSVHRLVQAVTADQMPGQLREGWRQAAAAVVEAALPGDPRQPGAWPVFAALLPHAQAALPADSDGTAAIGAYLGFSGGYAAARDFSRAMLEERAKVLGPDTRAPWPPAPTLLTGPAWRGMRPGPATSTPRCCPSTTGCGAPSTRAP